MNFVAIDFETANYSRSSACALGVVVVSEGKIVDRASWLIRPQKLYFRPDFIELHGITPADVRDKPAWDELWPEINEYLCGQTLVAHNASFDIGVLRSLFDEYSLDHPELRYHCTLQLSRRAWPQLPNHKLNTVSDFLGVSLQHHDALEDAMACAHIALHASRKLKVSSFHRS